MNKEYFDKANDDIVVIVAIETPGGVENIDQIAAVEGVDGIFIGPSDLSTSMGYLVNPSAPAVREAIKTIEEAVFKTDKFLSTIASDVQAAVKLFARGYGLVYTMSDALALSRRATAEIEQFNAWKRQFESVT
jgi:2-dehydro-3-deoxyglucarate aldolase/4-hydroxy-2-oxoheptanedioate aldolase